MKMELNALIRSGPAAILLFLLPLAACDSSTEPESDSDAWPGLEFRAEAKAVGGLEPGLRAQAILENVSNDTIRFFTRACAWLTLFEPGKSTAAFYPPRDLEFRGCPAVVDSWSIAPGGIVVAGFDVETGLSAGIDFEDIPRSIRGFPGPYRVKMALQTLPQYDPDATQASPVVEVFVDTGLEVTIPQTGSAAR